MPANVFQILAAALTAFSFMSASIAQAREIQIKGEYLDRESIKIVESQSRDGNLENDRISYQWCVYKEGCQPIGKADGFSRAELAQKFDDLNALASAAKTQRAVLKGAGGTFLVLIGLGIFVAASPVSLAILVVGMGVGGNAVANRATDLPINVAGSISPETFQREVYYIGRESNYGADRPIYAFKDSLEKALNFQPRTYRK